MTVTVKGPFGERQSVERAVDDLINEERWGKSTDPEGERAQVDTMQRVIKAVVSVLTDDQKGALAVLLDLPEVKK